MKVVFATPSLTGATAPYWESLKDEIPLIKDAGWEEGHVQELGCPYISNARSTMLRKALDAKADVVVFIDYDLSWRKGDLLKLIETEGDVVAGTYRFKQDKEKYMGLLYTDDQGRPIVREEDGAVRAAWAPAGFLKVTKEAVAHFMASYPELVYGPLYSPSVDLFNHGAHDGLWWGEDYAFCRRWNEAGGELWTVPDLSITHHATDKDGKDHAYPGNYHEFLLKAKPGSPVIRPPKLAA